MLTRSDLLALARKYRTLGELRRTQHQATRFEVRAPLRQLSEEFPGSLRELDMLPYEEIERRRDSFERAAAGGDVDEWMEWMHAYHSTMRAALAVKRELGGRRAVTAELAREMVTETRDFDVDFVRAVAHPPRGRLNAIVFERLEVRFGRTSKTIAEALFPVSRRA